MYVWICCPATWVSIDKIYSIDKKYSINLYTMDSVFKCFFVL